jgi:integrase
VKRRPYGTGGRIVRRGAKGIWTLEYTTAQGRRKESSHSTDREVANNLLKQRLGQIADGRILAVDMRRLTLKDLLDMVSADYALKGNKSTPPMGQLRAHLGDALPVTDLSYDTLLKYAQTRKAEKAAQASIRNELAVIGRGFTLAHLAGKLPQRPPIPTIKVVNARTGFFEAADLGAVLPHLPAYLRAYVEASYILGWRRSELVGLTWAQVDWQAGQLRLEHGMTKNGEGRVFPFMFHPRLAAVMRELHARRERIQHARGFLLAAVFVHDDGRPVSGWYYDAWRTACERAGLDGRMVHDFRRSAVRNLVRAGVPESVAMQLTGHKTRSVFTRYNITSGTDLNEAVAKLARFHSKQVRAGRQVVPITAGRRK